MNKGLVEKQFAKLLTDTVKSNVHYSQFDAERYLEAVRQTDKQYAKHSVAEIIICFSTGIQEALKHTYAVKLNICTVARCISVLDIH